MTHKRLIEKYKELIGTKVEYIANWYVSKKYEIIIKRR